MRKLFIAPLVLLAIAVTASTVGAHSRPVRFDPAPGSVLDAAPSEITGWFTSDIRRADESFIHVHGPDDSPVHTGEVQLSTDRRQMTTALESGLGEGRYLVHWSTFDDADGEVFSQCFTFYVGQAAADAALESGQAWDGGADCDASAEHSHEDGEMSAASISIEVVDIAGDSATLNITPVNFTPRAPDGNTVEDGFGHYHIYLDKVPVDILTGEHEHADGDGHADDMSGSTGSMDGMSGSTGATDDHSDDVMEHPGGLVENPVMWVENSYTFTNLEPGNHTIAVALNYDNHTSYDPPIIAETTFQIEGVGGDGSDGIPVWGLTLGIIGGLVVGGAGVKLATSRA